MKRSNPDPEADSPFSKKPRQKHHHSIHHRQSGAELAYESPQDPELVDFQLRRALCIALQAAGFACVKSDAITSFMALVDEYMTHFTHRVQYSMQHSRRILPTPLDFANALATHSIDPANLLPELKPGTSRASRTITTPEQKQPPLFLSPSANSTNDATTPSAATTFKPVRKSSYIPSCLPDFPPAHSYSTTPHVTERETDARRIRELATQEGVLAEQALRKLVAAKKAGRDRKEREKREEAKKQGFEDGRVLKGRVEKKGLMRVKDKLRAKRMAPDDVFRDALAGVMDEEKKGVNDGKGSGGITMRHEDVDLFVEGDKDEDILQLHGGETTKLGSAVKGPTEGHWNSSVGDVKDEEEIDPDLGSILVNYDRLHWRKGASGDGLGVA